MSHIHHLVKMKSKSIHWQSHGTVSLRSVVGAGAWITTIDLLEEYSLLSPPPPPTTTQDKCSFPSHGNPASQWQTMLCLFNPPRDNECKIWARSKEEIKSWCWDPDNTLVKLWFIFKTASPLLPPLCGRWSLCKQSSWETNGHLNHWTAVGQGREGMGDSTCQQTLTGPYQNELQCWRS